MAACGATNDLLLLLLLAVAGSEGSGAGSLDKARLLLCSGPGRLCQVSKTAMDGHD